MVYIWTSCHHISSVTPTHVDAVVFLIVAVEEAKNMTNLMRQNPAEEHRTAPATG